MTRRGRRNSNELVIIYWRDIPAQVTASFAGETSKLLLPPRFQTAIDRAAGVAGLNDAHAYVAQWRREHRPLDGDPASEAEAEAARIDTAYPRQRLQGLVRRGGLEENNRTTEANSIPPAQPEREDTP